MANEIAKLFSTLGFKIDYSGLRAYEQKLKSVQRQINSSSGVTGDYKKATVAQSNFYKEVTRGYARVKPTLEDHKRNLLKIREGFKQNRLSAEEYRNARLRTLNAISQTEKRMHRERMARIRREQKAQGPFAGGQDPRQAGNHRLISALHSDAALGALAGGFAVAQSSRSYQDFLAMQQGITAATGSLEQANKEMEYLHQLSNEMGLFMGDLGEDYAKFAASARDTSITIDQQRDIFKGVAAQVKVLNLSAADSKRIFRALSQMMSSGQIMAQELKLQMGDQLPGAMRAMARAAHEVGITQDDSIESMNKAMEAGLLLSEKVLPEFSNQLWIAANQGGALQKSITNTNAAFGRFQTNVWMANKILQESGLDKGIRDVTNSFSDFIFESQALWDFLGSTFGFFTQLLRGPIEFLTTLTKEFQNFTEWVNKAGFSTQQVIGIFSLLIPKIRKVIVPLVVLAYTLSAVSRAWEEGGFWNWAAAFGGIAASIFLLRKPLTGLARWSVNAKNNFKGLMNTLKGVKTSSIPETIRAPSRTGGATTAAENLRERVSRMNAQRAASQATSQAGKGLFTRLLGPLGPVLAGAEGAEELWGTNIAKFLTGRGYGTMDEVLYPPMGRPNALTVGEQQQARQMIVNGDIRFEIDGQDGPQIADEVIRVINENFIRPASMNDPNTEK